MTDGLGLANDPLPGAKKNLYSTYHLYSAAVAPEKMVDKTEKQTPNIPLSLPIQPSPMLQERCDHPFGFG